MTTEDILYAAWHRGIRDQVLDKLSNYDHLKEETHRKMEKAYNETIMEMKTSGDLEHREWDSAMLNSTTYNFKDEILVVEFKNGAEYSYKGINKSEYESFLNAESKGKHFIAEIRDKKEYSRNDDQKN
jgi:hypothetical protein